MIFLLKQQTLFISNQLIVGTCPQPELIESVITFMKDGYIETEYEREERMREDWLQKLRFNQNRDLVKLYTVWDNDRSGYINREEFKSKFYTSYVFNNILPAKSYSKVIPIIFGNISLN